jgi:hypothetical protein
MQPRHSRRSVWHQPRARSQSWAFTMRHVRACRSPLREDRPVMSAASRDWFRSSTWTPQIAEAFEVKLTRARHSSRAQYLYIQGAHLTASPEADVREAGRTLLRRVAAEYPDDFHAKSATEQLGESFAGEGRFDEAELAFRETVRLCAESPIGRSGTTGTPDLRLAEIILLRGDARRLDDVAALLDDAEPEVRGQSIMRDVVFRFLLASAQLADLRSDPRAAELAREALAVAAETSQAVPRHPDVGRPSATPDQLAELDRVAATG